MSKRFVFLLGALAALSTLAALAAPLRAGTTRPAAAKATTFTVTVENLSNAKTLGTSAGRVPAPISPGAWAVYSGANPLFAFGARADEGTERIAEDGDTTAKAAALKQVARVKESGVFSNPGGPLGPALEPGASATFQVSASAGDRLQFEAMFVQSNDYFYALGNDGLALFDPKGKPVSGNVTRYVTIWDAGTEVDEEPGNGTHAKPNQAPDATDVGPGTTEPVTPYNLTGDPWVLPRTAKLIRVTITPR